MMIVVVNMRIKPEYIEEFKRVSMDNARNSIKEPGIVRFDFLQQEDDPTRFVLYEAYKQPEDQVSHRSTAHYQTWKDRVADMMAEPRVGVKYSNLYPLDADWR
ncbi:MAG: antibiotic biosynthesis monooxygenase [Chloroflexi bacterium]|nr:antibiotic biosynthesis monooxygenase [Chloroflexota bacterium]